MKNQAPTKYFFGVTIDNKVYHFIIAEKEKKIYCCEFGIEYPGDIIEIKPNFLLRNLSAQTTYCLKDYLRDNPEKAKSSYCQNYDDNQQLALVQNYIIEPEIFQYLIENKMITYSYDMAILYNLDPTHAYDNRFKTNAFKRQRNDKTKILSKQKKGIFN